MHLLTTDRMTCPRCGPEFGLVLVTRRMEDRRVFEGFFGCPNCREEYPIEAGFGDLRPSPRRESEGGTLPAGDDPEGAIRIAALLGLREGSGFVLLAGGAVAYAAGVAALAEGLEVMALHPGLRAAPEEPGVSRFDALQNLPFRSGTLRGVVLEGPDAVERLREGARVLAPEARLVLFAPPAGSGDRLREMGFELLLEEKAAIVGVRRPPRAPAP